MRMKNTSTANVSMNLQKWKMYIWKTEVPVRSDGKRKYTENVIKYLFAEPTKKVSFIFGSNV